MASSRRPRGKPASPSSTSNRPINRNLGNRNCFFRREYGWGDRRVSGWRSKSRLLSLDFWGVFDGKGMMGMLMLGFCGDRNMQEECGVEDVSSMLLPKGYPVPIVWNPSPTLISCDRAGWHNRKSGRYSRPKRGRKAAFGRRRRHTETEIKTKTKNTELYRDRKGADRVEKGGCRPPTTRPKRKINLQKMEKQKKTEGDSNSCNVRSPIPRSKGSSYDSDSALWVLTPSAARASDIPSTWRTAAPCVYR